MFKRETKNAKNTKVTTIQDIWKKIKIHYTITFLTGQ